MSIIAHGVDIVVCAHRTRWRTHGDLFLERVFTAPERAYCLDCKTPAIRLSGRFAAKEAVLKVLGTGWRGGIQWTDIEVLPDAYGKPHCRLSGKTAELAAQLGITDVQVSISHAGEYAVATAIGID